MNILMLSADPNILNEKSDAHSRMIEYAALFDELHIIVAGRSSASRQNKNLFLYGVDGHSPLRSFAMYRLGKTICASIRFDVISAQNPDELGLVGYFLSRKFGVRLQLQVHTDVFSPWYRRVSIKEWMRYRLAKFLLRRAANVRAVSERIRKSIKESGIRNQELGISTLPIFTDMSKFFDALWDAENDERFKEYDFKMIAAGRFVEKEKHFMLLIEVMRDLVKEYPSALLVIVGNGPDRMNYESGIRNYGLEKNIILEPWRNDLASFYKSFDCFVLSSNYEGWGRAVIEAMAAGLPVIMTDVGLAGEVLRSGENGVVVPVGDKTAFVKAIETLYRDPLLRRQIAAKGQETVRNLEPRTKEEYLQRYKATFQI